MYYYINNFEDDIIDIADNYNNMIKNIRVKQGDKNSFDVQAFNNFLDKYKKIMYQLDIEVSYWKTVFEKEQTIDSKTLTDNNKSFIQYNQNQNKIIMSYILNNFFLQ
jgi:hypothetical protein